MIVVDIENGREHELPADTVTRDPQPTSRQIATLAPRADSDRGERTRGPLVPLAFRPWDEVFFVAAERWPELAGRPLRMKNGGNGLR